MPPLLYSIRGNIKEIDFGALKKGPGTEAELKNNGGRQVKKRLRLYVCVCVYIYIPEILFEPF